MGCIVLCKGVQRSGRDSQVCIIFIHSLIFVNYNYWGLRLSNSMIMYHRGKLYKKNTETSRCVREHVSYYDLIPAFD